MNVINLKMVRKLTPNTILHEIKFELIRNVDGFDEMPVIYKNSPNDRRSLTMALTNCALVNEHRDLWSEGITLRYTDNGGTSHDKTFRWARSCQLMTDTIQTLREATRARLHEIRSWTQNLPRIESFELVLDEIE